MTQDLDVFVVGGVGIDTIVRVPSLPPEDRESFHVPPVESYVAHTGHGVAFGCHALGLRTALADVIGDDPEGSRIVAAYAAAGVELRHVTHASGTRRAVNLVSPDGRRMSFYDQRHPPELLPDGLLWARGVQRARHVHVSIMGWARHALADAVAAGVTTSTDLHDWDGENPYHRAFALGADIVFVSGSALGERIDDVLAAILRDGRARVAVAMDGERGSRVAVPGRPGRGRARRDDPRTARRRLQRGRRQLRRGVPADVPRGRYVGGRRPGGCVRRRVGVWHGRDAHVVHRRRDAGRAAGVRWLRRDEVPSRNHGCHRAMVS